MVYLKPGVPGSPHFVELVLFAEGAGMWRCRLFFLALFCNDAQVFRMGMRSPPWPGLAVCLLGTLEESSLPCLTAPIALMELYYEDCCKDLSMAVLRGCCLWILS